MLTGAGATRVLSKRQTPELVAIQNDGQTMLSSPAKERAYQVETHCNQVFSAVGAQLVGAVITEIVANYDKMRTLTYRERVIRYAIEVGICKFLAPNHAPMLYRYPERVRRLVSAHGRGPHAGREANERF